jgi:hypothetical protein
MEHKNYKDLTLEEIKQLKILIGQAERDNSDEVTLNGITMDFEYASMLYNICSIELGGLEEE